MSHVAVESPPRATRPAKCRRCENVRGAHEYPLRNDPAAAGWATRTWCAPCLIARGHLRRAEAAAFAAAFLHEPTPAERAAEQRRADAAVAELGDDAVWALLRKRAARRDPKVAALLDAAYRDPGYAAARARAAAWAEEGA